jgi:hypothetical protein
MWPLEPLHRSEQGAQRNRSWNSRTERAEDEDITPLVGRKVSTVVKPKFKYQRLQQLRTHVLSATWGVGSGHQKTGALLLGNLLDMP